MSLKPLPEVSSLFLASLVLLLIANSPTVLAVTNQQVTFYSEPNKEGEATIYTEDQNVIPSPIANSRSFCVNLGLWKVTLDIPNANPSNPTSTVFYGGSLGTEFCRNRATPDDGRWSFKSWNVVGEGDLESSSLSVFNRTSYSGDSKFIDPEMTEMTFPTNWEARSFFITGPANWAVFPDPEFNGTAICWTSVRSSSGGTFGAKAVMTLDPPVLVGSVRRGCDGDEFITTRKPPPGDSGMASNFIASYALWVLSSFLTIWARLQ